MINEYILKYILINTLKKKINVIRRIYRLLKKQHMIISKDTEKALHKIQE